MNSISFFKALLMKELEEKDLPGNQEKIAQAAEPKDKITAADFAALRAKKSMKEEKNDKFYVSFKYPSGKVATIENLPKHINDTYKGALSSIRILKGYDEDRELATGHKVEGEWFVSDKNGNPIDQNGNIIKKQEIKEDHEVGMAHNSLESIIKSAMELKAKLGDNERNIPGWIQDHITNAENYINQASKNYHEYSNGEHDMDELPDGTEEMPAGDEEDAEMTLQNMMEELLEAKKKPSAGLSKKQKSTIAKKAVAGKDIGKKGKGFEKIASKAAKKYGSKERGQAVAAAAMWKSAAKKAK